MTSSEQSNVPSKREASPSGARDAEQSPGGSAWRSFIDAVEDYAIFMLDAQGNVMTWNRGAEKIKGYTPHEIIGRHFSTFYPAVDVEAGKPREELAIAREVGRVEDEGWRVRKDGSLFWANVVITALFDERGELRGFTKVTRDLTARRAAEEALRSSEERFRVFMASVVDYAMYMLDPSGVVTTWNVGAEKLKGYTAQEIIGRHFSVFFPPEDVERGKPQRELATALSEGRFEEEGFRVRKDGSRFWCNVTLTPMRDGHGGIIGFAKVTRDLTERAAAERTARELVREQAARAAAEEAESRVREAARLAEEAALRAEQASRVKDEFLATVSHELRTPLNAIVGWSSIIAGRGAEPALQRGLEIIHRNALAQSRIIDDILDVSRIVTGKLRLDVRASDLITIAQDALEVIRPAATARGVRLSFEAPASECTLVMDPERMRQVLWNLLSNAVKFTEHGGTVRLSIAPNDAFFEIVVSDSGRGIDPSFLPFVFDRFKQADSSSTRRVGGLGLGLAIVRHIVELHGGSVEAQSGGIGEGSTFVVRLPIRIEHALHGYEARPASVPPAAAASAPMPELAGTRVLVVDDEEDTRELLTAALRSSHAEVEVAASADEGLALLRRFRPHVLVSDIGMPDEDGYALIRRVRALPPEEGGETLAAALTAYTRTEDRERMRAAGFQVHLAKPAEPRDVVTAVAELAAQARAAERQG